MARTSSIRETLRQSSRRTRVVTFFLTLFALYFLVLCALWVAFAIRNLHWHTAGDTTLF